MHLYGFTSASNAISLFISDSHKICSKRALGFQNSVRVSILSRTNCFINCFPSKNNNIIIRFRVSFVFLSEQCVQYITRATYKYVTLTPQKKKLFQKQFLNLFKYGIRNQNSSHLKINYLFPSAKIISPHSQVSLQGLVTNL